MSHSCQRWSILVLNWVRDREHRSYSGLVARPEISDKCIETPSWRPETSCCMPETDATLQYRHSCSLNRHLAILQRTLRMTFSLPLKPVRPDATPLPSPAVPFYNKTQALRDSFVSDVSRNTNICTYWEGFQRIIFLFLTSWLCHTTLEHVLWESKHNSL